MFDESGAKIALNQFVTFLVGSGNFGGKRDSDKQIKVSGKKMSRKPDQIRTEKTTVDQAALYRLNGDLNPLHIDPSFSGILGFDKPILHGLCTYGITCRAVLESYCDYDATKIVGHDVRFSSPVFPGETIVTRMWKDANVVSFEASVKERPGVTVIKNGKTTLAS